MMRYLKTFLILMSSLMIGISVVQAMEEEIKNNDTPVIRGRTPAGLLEHLSPEDLRTNPCVLVHLDQEEYQPQKMQLTLADQSAFEDGQYNLMDSLYASLARDVAPDLFPYGGWLEEQIPDQYREQLRGLKNEDIGITPALVNRVLYLNALVNKGEVNFGDTSLADEHRRALTSSRVEECFIGYDLLSLAKAQAFASAFYEVLRHAHINKQTQEVEWGENWKVRMANQKLREVLKQKMIGYYGLALSAFDFQGDIQKRQKELNVLEILSREEIERAYGKDYTARDIFGEGEATTAEAAAAS